MYPGDVHRERPIRRRDDDETERELAVDRSDGVLPGGAEGGDESRSADLIIDYPGQREPFGDTDQISDSGNLPPERRP